MSNTTRRIGIVINCVAIAVAAVAVATGHNPWVALAGVGLATGGIVLAAVLG